jgi:hypothetical protein
MNQTVHSRGLFCGRDRLDRTVYPPPIGDSGSRSAEDGDGWRGPWWSVCGRELVARPWRRAKAVASARLWGRRRRTIQPAVLARLRESKQTGTEYYVLMGYRRLNSGQEWVDALDEIVRRVMQRGRRWR